MTIIESDGLRLWCHLARPPQSAGRGSQFGIVLCHGLPRGSGEARAAGMTFPQLADRVAQDTAWTCLSFGFRGMGTSTGAFGVAGWLDDLRHAVQHLRSVGVERVWLAGFDLGGTLAIHVAATDPTVRGVAALGALADLSPWIGDPAQLVRVARGTGALGSDAPVDAKQWSSELRAIDPVASSAAVPPRPFLVVHGSADDVVPAGDARLLADAAPGCEVHVIPMGGHRLSHDPRAIALLLGWLDRQAS